jgi:uncharacterized BrkB/YihY/UPF0761 family membrane protein
MTLTIVLGCFISAVFFLILDYASTDYVVIRGKMKKIESPVETTPEGGWKQDVAMSFPLKIRCAIQYPGRDLLYKSFIPVSFVLSFFIVTWVYVYLCKKKKQD